MSHSVAKIILKEINSVLDSLPSIPQSNKNLYYIWFPYVMLKMNIHYFEGCLLKESIVDYYFGNFIDENLEQFNIDLDRYLQIMNEYHLYRLTKQKLKTKTIRMLTKRNIYHQSISDQIKKIDTYLISFNENLIKLRQFFREAIGVFDETLNKPSHKNIKYFMPTEFLNKDNYNKLEDIQFH